MSMRTRSRIVVAMFTSLLVSGFAQVSAAEGCNDASAVGSYAFKVDGTNVSIPLPGGPGPFAAVGKNTYDGMGHMAGVIVVSSNGTIISATYTGTYHVNTDCTGYKTFTLSIGGTVGPTIDMDFVLDDDLREIRMIISDPGFAVSGSARKLFTDAESEETE